MPFSPCVVCLAILAVVAFLVCAKAVLHDLHGHFRWGLFLRLGCGSEFCTDSLPQFKCVRMLLLSKSTFKEMKRLNLQQEALEQDPVLKKRTVDSAFDHLMKKVLRPVADLETAYDKHQRLVFEHKQLAETKCTLKKQGNVVVLLSTGQCGIIAQDEKHGKGGRKVSVVLDGEEEPIKVPNSALYWMKYCHTKEDALLQIQKRSRLVPQVSDLAVGSRVCVVKLNYQTGVVKRAPKPSTLQTCFVVKMDGNGREEVRCVAEDLRLIAENQEPVVLPLRKPGRPSLEQQHTIKKQRAAVASEIVMLTPKSKESEEWVKSLRAPKHLPPPPPTIFEEEEDNEEDTEESADEDKEFIL